DAAPSWRTIMSYNCPAGCTRLQYWSNPNIQFGGIAMGTTATNDNARVLNGTNGTVAAFRSRFNPDVTIWRFTGTPCSGTSCPGWQRLDNNTKTARIAASGGNLYQLHNDGMIWKSTGAPCNGNSCPGWQLLDNNTKTVAIEPDGGNLYQLHNDGMIWKFTGTP